jgi:hypothetical protein
MLTTICCINSPVNQSYHTTSQDNHLYKPFHERRRGNAILWCCLDARRPMHRPNPRSSPLLSRASSPKSRARSCSSHSKSTFHPPLAPRTWLGVCFLLLSLPSLPTRSLHSLERLWLLHSLCIQQLFIPTSHTKPTSIGYHTNVASLSSFNNTKVSQSEHPPIHPSIARSGPSPPRTRRRRHHCYHPPCDTRPNTATCARQTLHQPAPIANHAAYKACLPCPN